MRAFRPLPPPDTDDPFDINVWLRASRDAHQQWVRDFEREVARQRRIMNVLSVVVPAACIVLGIYALWHHSYGFACMDFGLAAGNITFRWWIERKSAQRLAENKRRVALIFADIERENDLGA